MKSISVIFIVAKYPATYGHTSVINNLCHGLNELGHKTAIGAFSFDSDPPKGVKKVILKKNVLLRSGVASLEYDIIHPHQAQVLYYLLFKKPEKPIVFHYHAASNMIQELNLKSSMKLFKKRISKFISVSKKASHHLEEWAGKCDDVVIYNGVDTKFFHPGLEQPYRKGSPQLLFVSVLRKYKKTVDLISAMPELLKTYPKAHLQIVGNGEDFSRLQNIIKKKNLEKNIEMTGRIDDEELRLRYASCDMYVSASTNEHCPVPTFEAMACGRPLVLSELESHMEIINVSKAGLAFSFSDNHDLCQKIINVYENKEVFGKDAIKFVQNHSLQEFSKRVEEIYNKILNQ
tara:strand:+ start:1339 stop:2376 length:1038 start_codon:yes stop_codon:yes gene_type:complete